jgi:hypothetical protein
MMLQSHTQVSEANHGWIENVREQAVRTETNENATPGQGSPVFSRPPTMSPVNMITEPDTVARENFVNDQVNELVTEIYRLTYLKDQLSNQLVDTQQENEFLMSELAQLQPQNDDDDDNNSTDSLPKKTKYSTPRETTNV